MHTPPHQGKRHHHLCRAEARTTRPHRKNLVISFHNWTIGGPGGGCRGRKVAGRGSSWVMCKWWDSESWNHCRDVLRYLPPCWTTGSSRSPPRSSAQPLISSSLSTWNAATLGHPCCAASIKDSAGDVLCVRPLKTISRAEVRLSAAALNCKWHWRRKHVSGGLTACVSVGIVEEGAGGWGVVRGGSRCTGSPEAGVDIWVKLISHAVLMQKPFNCFQPSSTLWFPLTGPLLCFA